MSYGKEKGSCREGKGVMCKLEEMTCEDGVGGGWESPISEPVANLWELSALRRSQPHPPVHFQLLTSELQGKAFCSSHLVCGALV